MAAHGEFSGSVQSSDSSDVEVIALSDSDGGQHSDSDIVLEEEEGAAAAADFVLPGTPMSPDGLCSVISVADVLAMQAKDAQHTAATLNVRPSIAAILLRHTQWREERLLDKWFKDSAATLTAAGVARGRAADAGAAADEASCGVCYGFGDAAMFALDCGHSFCGSCWAGYLASEVSQGPLCLRSKCMGEGCKVVVDADVYARFVGPELLERYRRFAAEEYVTSHPASLKYCTRPGCPLLASYPGFAEVVHVACRCGQRWCFFCAEELHSPASCDLVAKWNQKNSSTAETTSWIIANTKPCPICRIPIQKNQGCMHMTCVQCRHEFCWLCRGPWKEHGTSTGGFYNCNRYTTSKAKGQDDEVQTTKDQLDRYLHFFERYHSHGRAHTLLAAQRGRIEGRAQEYALEAARNGSFLVEAFDLVLAAKQTLKWSYVYGYYNEDPVARALFETQQENLEMKTEALYEVLERSDALAREPAQATRIIDLTKLVRKYLGNLVRSWEARAQ